MPDDAHETDDGGPIIRPTDPSEQELPTTNKRPPKEGIRLPEELFYKYEEFDYGTTDEGPGSGYRSPYYPRKRQVKWWGEEPVLRLPPLVVIGRNPDGTPILGLGSASGADSTPAPDEGPTELPEQTDDEPGEAEQQT